MVQLHSIPLLEDEKFHILHFMRTFTRSIRNSSCGPWLESAV